MRYVLSTYKMKDLKMWFVDMAGCTKMVHFIGTACLRGFGIENVYYVLLWRNMVEFDIQENTNVIVDMEDDWCWDAYW